MSRRDSPDRVTSLTPVTRSSLTPGYGDRPRATGGRARRVAQRTSRRIESTTLDTERRGARMVRAPAVNW